MPKKVTDLHLLAQLDKPNDWEFFEDYTKEYPSTKIYLNRKTGEQLAVCQGLPKVRHDGLKICGSSPNETTIGWFKSPAGYTGKPNVFSVATVGRKVYLKRLDNQKRVNWKPRVSLNGVEQSCGEATLLGLDPTNPNYYSNILEWDYGFLKRRLRQIEGGIFDRKIIESNPHGEVRVKLNQSGNLKLNLSGAVDAEGNSLGRVEGDEEIVSAEEFDRAVYPVIIGALTVYSTSNDGYAAIGLTSDTWANVRAGNGTTSRYNQTSEWSGLGRKSAGDFQCARGLFPFDVSAAGGATVSTGTFSLYWDTIGEADADAADLALVEGVQQDPIVNSDYEAHYTKTTEGSDTRMTHPQSLVAYTVLTLNATGIGWVQAAIDGAINAKFCTRVKCDIDGVPEPTGMNGGTVFQNEDGAGKQPRLVITYIIAKTSSDTGTGVEGLGSRVISLQTETGSGADALIVKGMSGYGDAGVGVEGIGDRDFSLVETGTGTDRVRDLVRGWIRRIFGTHTGKTISTHTGLKDISTHTGKDMST